MNRIIAPLRALATISVFAVGYLGLGILPVAGEPGGARGMAQGSSTAGAGKIINLSGANVYYEEMGRGVPLVLNTGGRNLVEHVRPLAQKLAGKYRVIMWDRANMGRSDVVFKGARDVDLWSDQLAELLQVIGAQPAYLAGASIGGRVSYVTAVRYPDVVRGLFLYIVSANDGLAESLGARYYGQYADLAEKQGMQAVANADYWAMRVQANPNNLGRFLAMDPGQFARVMRRWQRAMRSSDPVIQATEDDLRQLNLSGIPIRITAGCADDSAHNLARSQRMAKLIPNAEFSEPPGFCQAWAKSGKEPGASSVTGPIYERHPMLPELITDFITRTEAKAGR